MRSKLFISPNFLLLLLLVLCAVSFPGMAMHNQDNVLLSSVAKKGAVQEGPNKESYQLCEENFSQSRVVNFKGVYSHIHYPFKDQTLLLDALFPLLSQALQQKKQDFEHLEFLGDAVLGLLTRERILSVFPAETRGMHNELYQALTCNRTLTTVYLQDLIRIEQSLPYPGRKLCQYCNVVESLIGAIYTDDGNRLENPRKFVMRFLSDHLLQEKYAELQGNLAIAPLLPSVRAVIDELLVGVQPAAINPKSFLSELLSKAFQDHAEYQSSLGRNKEGSPVFVAHVVGAQIGNQITGEGVTKTDAEEDAARNAIHFLAPHVILPPKAKGVRNYAQFIREYGQSQQWQVEYTDFPAPQPSFIFKVKREEIVLGEGVASSKAAAKEKAAEAACASLIAQREMGALPAVPGKSSISLLKEWGDQAKERAYQLIDAGELPLVFAARIRIGDFTTEAQGKSKDEARENGARIAFGHLLAKQEKVRQQQENLQEYARLKGPQKKGSPLSASPSAAAAGGAP